MRCCKLIILFIVINLCHSLFAQTKQDSIPFKNLFKSYDQLVNSNPDSALLITNEIEKIANKLGNNFILSDVYLKRAILNYYKNDFETSKQFALKSIKLATRYQNYKALVRAQNLSGALAYLKADFKNAEWFYLEKIKTTKLIKDTSNEMITYYNLGLIYSQTGQYLKSAEVNFIAAKYFERIKDTFNLIFPLQSIGITYSKLDDSPSAFRFLYRAMGLCKKINEYYQLAGLYVDLSEEYSKTFNESVDSVKKYLDLAFNLANEKNDAFHKAVALNSKAIYYLKLEDFESALKFARNSYYLNLERDNQIGVCDNLRVMSTAFLKLNLLDSSLYYSKKGYLFALKLNQVESLLENSLTISKIYENKRLFDSSLKYHQYYFKYYSTVEKTAQLRGIAKKELLLEKENQDQLRAKEQLISQTKLEKQKQINTIVIVASVLLSILLVISFVNYRQKQKANIEILKQKKMLEEKQKEIHDSIVYASRIQKSLMPTSTYLKKKLHENN